MRIDILSDKIVSADSGKAVFSLSPSGKKHENTVMDVDIYHSGRREHPLSHIGWWKFEMPSGAFRVVIRVTPDGTVAGVSVIDDSGERKCLSFWRNETVFCAPRQDVLFVARQRDGTLLSVSEAAYTLTEAVFLKRFYEHLHAEDHRSNPFLEVLHRHKIHVIRRLLRRFLREKSRALDIGSAYSIFTQITLPESPDVFCIDIGEMLVRRRSRTHGSIRWVVGNGGRLPFRERSFHLVFAGEIIEHFRDEEIPGILSTWRNVLLPGGIMILTTPNRLRRLNRINRSATPFGPDHFREFSPGELRKLLENAGLEVLLMTGLYIELLVSRTRPGTRVDLLQTRCNRNMFKPLMSLLAAMGRLWPSRALDLIVAARRP